MATSLFTYARPFDIADGDFDGDGREEIMACCVGDVWILDDASADDQVVKQLAFPRQGGAQQHVSVAAGDTDGDGRAEVVVVDGTIVDEAKSIGLRASMSVGTEFEDRLFIQSKVSFKATVESSLDFTANASKGVQIWWAFA